MEVEYKIPAQEDLRFWKKTGDKQIQKRISALIEDICEHPFTGKGKPEALKYELSGKWSRRIDEKNRIIYSVTETLITIYSLRGHYFDK